MTDGFCVPALLQFLGHATARAVLANVPYREREQLAVEAVTHRGSGSGQTERTVRTMGRHLMAYSLVATVGVTAARRKLLESFDASVVDGLLERVTTMGRLSSPAAERSTVDGGAFDSLAVGPMAHALAFLPAEHAAELLQRHAERVGALALASDAAGLFEHFGDCLATLEGLARDELLDGVAEADAELATRLQVHICGSVDLLDLEYDELAAVLGGAAVEDIALALMAADQPVRRRCLDVMGGVRGALVEAHIERPGPVQVGEIDAAAQRLSYLVGDVLDARLAPMYV